MSCQCLQLTGGLCAAAPRRSSTIARAHAGASGSEITPSVPRRDVLAAAIALQPLFSAVRHSQVILHSSYFVLF